MEIIDLVSQCLEKIESERVTRIEEDILKEKNSGWFVQYFPCGHSREINWREEELVKLAENNKKVDAIILSSKDCPLCYVMDSIDLLGV